MQMAILPQIHGWQTDVLDAHLLININACYACKLQSCLKSMAGRQLCWMPMCSLTLRFAMYANGHPASNPGLAGKTVGCSCAHSHSSLLCMQVAILPQIHCWQTDLLDAHVLINLKVCYVCKWPSCLKSRAGRQNCWMFMCSFTFKFAVYASGNPASNPLLTDRFVGCPFAH